MIFEIPPGFEHSSRFGPSGNFFRMAESSFRMAVLSRCWDVFSRVILKKGLLWSGANGKLGWPIDRCGWYSKKKHATPVENCPPMFFWLMEGC